MKIYKILGYPADFKIKVFGKDLPELFCNLVKAIAQEMGGGGRLAVRNGEWESVEIESLDLFSLLVDFAGEIIYRSDVNKQAYVNCKILQLSKGNKILRTHKTVTL